MPSMLEPASAPSALCTLLRFCRLLLVPAFACCWLSSCATQVDPDVTTTRSPEFTAERLAKGGSVLIVKGRTPTKLANAISEIEEKHFRAKGFSVAPKPASGTPTADYGFYSFATTMPAYTGSGSLTGEYSHSVQASFVSILEGKFDKVMWEGTAKCVGSEGDSARTQATLLKHLLARFPD